MNKTPKILIVRLSAIGDVVHSTPVLHSLRKKFPDSYIAWAIEDKASNILINNLYGLKITHRLIQITLPKVLARDYLSCVVLYHELGHFVDLELYISKKLFLQKYHKINPENDDEYMYLRHKMELYVL